MIGYLIDAVPSTFLAMVALAAEGLRRSDGTRYHWFLRTSVVVVLLLPLLLVPAYELLIAGTVQMLTIVGGLALWRSRKSRQQLLVEFARRYALDESNAAPDLQPRIALRTVFLATIPLTIALAALASFPHLPWTDWVHWVAIGCIIGGVPFFCIWLVYGQTHIAFRLLAGVLFCIAMGLAIPVVEVTFMAVVSHVGFSRRAFDQLLQPETQAWIMRAWLHFSASLAIAIGLLCSWIVLMRHSLWFAPPTEIDPSEVLPKTKRTLTARWALLTVFICTVALPLVILVKLASPTPKIEPPSMLPSFFAHLYEAGRLIEPALEQILRSPQMLTDQQKADLLPGDSAAFLEMRQAFSASAMPSMLTIVVSDATDRLERALAIRLNLAIALQQPEMILEASLDFLQLQELLSRGYRNFDGMRNQSSTMTLVATELHKYRDQLTRDQRHEFLQAVHPLVTKRHSWDQLVDRQRINDENRGWQSHLQVILDDWKGEERYAFLKYAYLYGYTKMSVFLTELALHSYQEDHGQLPNRLDELAPSYLPSLIDDPFGSGPLKYRQTNDGYLLYSIGPNGKDNGGQPLSSRQEGDLLSDELLKTP